MNLQVIDFAVRLLGWFIPECREVQRITKLGKLTGGGSTQGSTFEGRGSGAWDLEA